jgi:FKBP-type peptidyl-prolyl cis-trans isomerase
VHYSGALANGTIFDANGAAQTPFQFVLGQGHVIAGWDEGIVGMQVGGTRQLIIPPALGYGVNGYGSIPGSAILVFTVIMVSTS